MGGASYPVTLPITWQSGCSYPGPPGGYQVLVLDRTDLSPILNRGFATGDYCTGDAEMRAMTQALTDAAAGDRLVFVVSIDYVGLAGRDSSAASALAAALQGLGGTADTVFRLANGTYRLVGTAGAGHAETSSLMKTSPLMTEALQGVVARTRDGRFEPKMATAYPATFDLAGIMAQPISGWPEAGTQWLDAAQAYIAQELGLPGPSVRWSYTDPSVDWTAKAAILKALTYPAGTTTFSATDFSEVSTQLLLEFGWVTQARAYLASVSDALATGTGLIDMQRIAEYAEALVPVSPDTSVSVDYADLVTAALSAGTPVSAAAGSAMSVAATAVTVTSDVANRADGSPAGAVRTQSIDLGAELAGAAAARQAAVSILERQVLTDAGRLQAAGEAVAANPAWTWSPAHTATVIQGMNAGGTQAVFGPNLRASFPAFVFRAAPGGAASAGDIRCAGSIVFGPGASQPFLKVPQFGQWVEAAGNAGEKRIWVPAIVTRKPGVESITLPSSAAFVPVFLPSTFGGGGAYAPFFFRRTWGDPGTPGAESTAVTLPAKTGSFAGCG